MRVSGRGRGWGCARVQDSPAAGVALRDARAVHYGRIAPDDHAESSYLMVSDPVMVSMLAEPLRRFPPPGTTRDQLE